MAFFAPFAARVAVLASAALLATPAVAHFQEILPSVDVLDEGGSVELQLLFTHPFEGGPVMDTERPAEAGVIINGQKTVFTDELTEKKADNGARTWALSHELIEPGAAIFYVSPQAYWEPAENLFIVHHAKVVVDNYASGIGWDEMVGLPVEIQPLSRPTGLWAGNAFTGIVTKNGEPVPFAEVEVAYVNEKGIKAPNDAYPVQTVKADANGTFSYVMPQDGWWGFVALLEGDEPLKAPNGEMAPVEEGGAIWVHAKPMSP